MARKHPATNNPKVAPMKKRFQPNIALFIFLLILLYVIVLAWGYLTKSHISIYEVNTSELNDDTPIYGFAMREEQIFYADGSGYVNYYNAEGNRVGKGDVVYTLDGTGEISDLLGEIQNQNTSSQDITSMRKTIASFQNSFNFANYGAVSDLTFNINNTIFQQNNKTLYSDLNKAIKKAGQSKNFSKHTASVSGVISYAVDGYEDIKEKNLTPELLDEYGKEEKKQVKTKEKVESGAPVYKLVTSNDWSLYVNLSDSYYQQLKSLNFVRVTIEKDGISFNASVEMLERDGAHIAKLSTSRFMERYINDRFLKLEFDLNKAEGLKIPNSSILKKEYYVLPRDVVYSGEGQYVMKQVINDEGIVDKEKTEVKDYYLINNMYYVDSNIVKGGDILFNPTTQEDYIVSSKENLYGVYCVNQGFCQFKAIDILYQNKEYTIVGAGTAGGLAPYDHIIVDASQISEDDFID
ncbi:MAG: hypothetical protein K6G62_08250 [Eubacterium sp.]|nr:hypothetical protein [Eubacterium sp.]